MPTDDERREVARRLRHAWTNVPDRNPVRHQLRVLLEVYEAVGLVDGESDAIDLFGRLADLICPDTTTDTTKSPDVTTKCDRDALLELAEEAKKCAWYFGLDHDSDELRDRLEEAAADFLDFASRIREACGEGEA